MKSSVFDKRGINLIIVFFLGFAILLTLYVSANSKKAGINFFGDSNVELYSQPIQIQQQGGAWEDSAFPCSLQGKKGRTTTLKTTLKEMDVVDETLLLYVPFAKSKVSLDGQVLEQYDAKSPLIFSYPTPRWILLTLPEDYAGKELSIEITPFLSIYENMDLKLYQGTHMAALRYVLSQGAFSLLSGSIMTLMGMIILLTALMLNKTLLHGRLLLLGLMSMDVGIWIFVEGKCDQFLFDKPLVPAYMCFSAFYFLPLFCSAFLLTYEFCKNSKCLKCAFILSTVNFIVVHVLQVTTIRYLVQMVYSVYALMALILVGVVYDFLKWKREGNHSREDVLIYPILLIGAFAIADVIHYMLKPPIRGPHYTKIGILVMFMVMFYQIIKMIGDAQKEELYRELAYNDMMTGLKNRSAFEERLSEIRNMKKHSGIIIFMADLNDLKKINDTYGHAAGDRALTILAQQLKKAFAIKTDCYRIGGDEFCAISELPLDAFEKNLENLEEELQKERQNVEFDIQVAYSYRLIGNEKLDDCIREVDQEMYQVKRKQKMS